MTTGRECSCGEVAKFERRPKRAGYSERIVCPGCGKATVWKYAGPNGMHRPELIRAWALLVATQDGKTDGHGQARTGTDANADCERAAAMLDGVVAGLDRVAREG